MVSAAAVNVLCMNFMFSYIFTSLNPSYIKVIHAVKVRDLSICSLLVLQHIHDYLQCQNRYNMSVLPRMKLKNKIADMWIDWPSIGIACQTFEPVLS